MKTCEYYMTLQYFTSVKTLSNSLSIKHLELLIHFHILESELFCIVNTIGRCHTLILDLKILTQISLLFSNAFKSTVFPTVLQLHTLLFQSFNFCIKSYKRVFWSFPTKEPIFNPYNLSLSLVNLFA